MNEVEHVLATHRLGIMRGMHPDLTVAENTAKLALAEAIIEMDAADAQNDNPSMSIIEQQEVNRRLIAYGNALADLLRGDNQEED